MLWSSLLGRDQEKIMKFKKGDKITGRYLGQYDFEGVVWHTSARSKGQNLYVELEKPIFVGQFIHPRYSIYVETDRPENEIEIVLDFVLKI